MNVDNLQVFTVHIILQIEIHSAQKGRNAASWCASIGWLHSWRLKLYSPTVRFLTFPLSERFWARLGQTLLRAPGSSVSEIASLAVDADALLVCWADIPGKLISQLKRCRFISLYTAGFNNVDLGAAAEAGIAVSNNPGYCTDEVATHTLSLLLACHRRLFLLEDRVKSGIWEPVASMQPTPSLKEQTVGILGYGRNGRQVAEWVAPLCGRVLAYERDTKISPQDSAPAEMVSLDQLLRESDYLSIHLPLNSSTRHMLGRDALREDEAHSIHGEHFAWTHFRRGSAH